MNYECLRDLDGAQEWVTCTVVDSYTSPTHWYVRCELGGDSDHVWLPHEQIRRISQNGSCEPSY